MNIKLPCLLLALIASLTSMTIGAKEIARYHLNGNAIDSGPDARNGVIQGNVASTSDRFGQAGGALRFTGGLIRVDAFRNYNFGSETTVSVWMRRDVVDGYMGIINNGLATKTLDLRMGRENQGTFIFARSDWTTGATSSSSVNFITIGQWYHVTVRLKDGASSLFINGQKLGEQTVALGTLRVVSTPLIIGSNANGLGHEPFRGALDDIRIFDHALSDSDIQALFNGTYQASYDIGLTPFLENEVIPSSGGQLFYNAAITNSDENAAVDFAKWSVLTLPNGEDYPIHLLENVSIGIGQTVTYSTQELSIPAWFPAGQYTYRWYVADPLKPSGNILQSSFIFTKSP